MEKGALNVKNYGLSTNDLSQLLKSDWLLYSIYPVNYPDRVSE